MKSQPTRAYMSNDVVMTPPALAQVLVAALRPAGRLLDPCAGSGAFTAAFTEYGESLGFDIRDDAHPGFEWWTAPVDWVITNPPWSQFRRFLVHAMEIADHVAFLATVNHWWTRRRVRDVAQAGFGYRQLWLVPWPSEWPPSGFQLGCMYLERHYKGPLEILTLPPPSP